MIAYWHFVWIKLSVPNPQDFCHSENCSLSFFRWHKHFRLRAKISPHGNKKVFQNFCKNVWQPERQTECKSLKRNYQVGKKGFFFLLSSAVFRQRETPIIFTSNGPKNRLRGERVGRLNTENHLSECLKNHCDFFHLFPFLEKVWGIRDM